MPLTIADLEAGVLDLLEESRTAPKFWTTYETRTAIVEAMNEATLITGEPEVRSNQPFTITANTTFQNMPDGAIALVRVEGPNNVPLFKTSVLALDRSFPGWQNTTDTAPGFWFPYGLTKWGVYPQATADVNCVLTYIAFPVTTARPYTGGEAVPFQVEYEEGLREYAQHTCRFKEAGLDFQQSFPAYRKFLSSMQELTRFAIRKGALRFTLDAGTMAKITDVKGVS